MFARTAMLKNKAMRLKKTNNLLIVGALPPPVCGMTVITEHVYQALNKDFNPKIVNLPAGGRSRHFRKIVKVFVAAMNIVRHLGCAGRKVLYLPVDSGLGMYYILILSGLARLCKYEVYLHHHSWLYISSSDWRISILSKLINKYGGHIFLCDKMRSEFSLRYPNVKYNRLLKVSNKVFMKVIPAINEAKTKDLIIGHMSNLCFEKGLDIVISVFRKLLGEGYKVRLRLAGPSLSRESTRLIEETCKELGDKIDYLGPIYGQEKTEFFMNINVFLFPTRYKNEAQPLVLLEAMCCGVPVIAYSRGCIESILGDNGGELIDIENDFEIEALPFLRELALDDNSRTKASMRAIQQIKYLCEEARYDMENLIKVLAE